MDRILVVDDDQAFTVEAKEYLSRQDYEVDVAYDRLEAAQKLDEFCPDVLVLDLRLPIPNLGIPSKNEGTEVLHQVLRDYDLPVIIFTIVDDPEVQRLILQYGADQYVIRTQSDMARLALNIRNLLRRYPRKMRCLSSRDKRLCLNPITREVKLNGKPIAVGFQDRFKFLHYLMLNGGQFVSGGDLLWEVWEETLPDFDCEERRRKLRKVIVTLDRLESQNHLVGYFEHKKEEYSFKERVGSWRCRKEQ